MNQGIKTTVFMALLLIAPFFAPSSIFAEKETIRRCPFCSTPKIDCPHCNEKDFESHKEYKAHFIEVHTKSDEKNGKKNMYCIPCQKTIKDNAINMHLKQKCHMKNLLKCPFCKKAMCRATELKDHIYRRHVLTQKFSSQDDLLFKHVIDLHLSGNLLCAICQKGFISNRILKIHKKTHSNKKRKKKHCVLLRKQENIEKTTLHTEPDNKKNTQSDELEEETPLAQIIRPYILGVVRSKQQTSATAQQNYNPDVSYVDCFLYDKKRERDQQL